jgi:pSer/pThr/pTyr-binding forkhead associated (FHA) protein
MAELLLTLREREISRVPVTHTRVIIGRDATCDVVIDNAGVSRNHAVVVFVEGEFRVRDTESQNGITVNGKRVAEATLEYGDVIGIGKFELKLRETEDEVELESGTAVKSNAPRSVMATMQMDGAAAARMRDEILAKQKAKGGKRAGVEAKAPAGANAKAPAGANASAGAQKARPKPAAGDRPRREAPQRPAASAHVANESAIALPGTQSLMRKPAAIAAMIIVPIALIALWLMRG